MLRINLLFFSYFICYRIAKLDDSIGKIQVGRRADLLLFDDALNLQQTFVFGKPVYTAEKDNETTT